MFSRVAGVCSFDSCYPTRETKLTLQTFESVHTHAGNREKKRHTKNIVEGKSVLTVDVEIVWVLWEVECVFVLN